MKLILALYAEGSSDDHFLPMIIWRTAQSITSQYGPVVISSVAIISRKQGAREECILRAAMEACDCHALIVHSDADDRTSERAYKERIQPGFDRVLKVKSTENVCERLIPLIPVQMSEAWMLADSGTLLDSIKADRRSQDLKLPKVSEVERDANPKATLNEIIRKVNLSRSSSKRTARRSEINVNDCYEYLATNMDLNILALVPSYQAFSNDLTQALISILNNQES